VVSKSHGTILILLCKSKLLDWYSWHNLSLLLIYGLNYSIGPLALLLVIFSNQVKSNKKIKGKTPGKGTREQNRKDQSPNKRPHSKAQNTQ